jgi:hypothetical protein
MPNGLGHRPEMIRKTGREDAISGLNLGFERHIPAA